MAFECPRRSSPPSPMFDADTGCIATDPAPSARRRFRSKTGIENLPANEHAQETPHTPSPTRTTRRIQSGCAGSRPRLRDGMPGSPSQHIDITRAKWIPYFPNMAARTVPAGVGRAKAQIPGSARSARLRAFGRPRRIPGGALHIRDQLHLVPGKLGEGQADHYIFPLVPCPVILAGGDLDDRNSRWQNRQTAMLAQTRPGPAGARGTPGRALGWCAAV